MYQRPHHLMSRFARTRRVFFVEEPLLDSSTPYLEIRDGDINLTVLVVHVPEGTDEREAEDILRALVSPYLAGQGVTEAVLWYYTPMAVGWTPSVEPTCVVYDCMDELSAFKDAPPALLAREAQLLREADLVFTGGMSLYEAKQDAHESVHCFPSSVDVPHFARARTVSTDPADQAAIARPRLGFFGVIDERMDLDLLRSVAEMRPDWQLVIIGPVVKVEEDVLPRLPNIHYLGPKSYAALPEYAGGWDVAMLPFAHNESTRFISPTKTPEYLAAGLPMVSTSIRDVVRPYGERGLVRIADTPTDFIAAVERALAENPAARHAAADEHIRDMSWDHTWSRMNALIEEVERERMPLLVSAEREGLYV